MAGDLLEGRGDWTGEEVRTPDTGTGDWELKILLRAKKFLVLKTSITIGIVK